MTDGSSQPSLALVNSSSRFSGITRSAEPYATALARLGFRVRWYQCVDRGTEPYVPPGGVTVPGVGLPLKSLEMGINRLWMFPHRLSSVPEEILLLTDPTLSFASRGHRTTAVLVHDLLPLTEFADRRASRWMFRAVIPRLRRMHLVVVTTVTLRSELIGRGVDASHIRVIPYTHELGFHPDHPARSIERIARTGVVRLLYVATDRPFKNLNFVLELARALGTRRTGLRFTITVLSRVRPETARRIADLQLSNLRVVPQVPRIEELYDESDILIYPSLHEGFGRPLIEAMAYGLPVVANRIQPLTDILGGAGILLDVQSVDPWVAALLSLSERPVFTDLTQRALERGAMFLPDRFQTSVDEAFHALLEGARS